MRPLGGGFDAWQESGYPLETRLVQVGDAARDLSAESATPPA
ncbi:MAG TPA: hypothetical protein VGW33_10400 [Terriglobia bacterium]|nr:hypothetical protein [Terriglobia bacterium]